jgi:septal ring factor EnvC (AmiA/AmiB activator)
MAQRRNYGFERRQKETARRSRQEAKRERKSEREQQGESGPEMGTAGSTGPPPGRWEWFSPSRGRVVTTEAGQRPDETPDDWSLLTSDTGDGAAAGSEA